MLTPKQSRFVEEYLVDLNGTQAAIRAGYSQKTAASIADENLRKPYIREAIQAAREQLQQRTEITQEWVVRRLVENVERSSQAKPVLDKEGKPTGVFAYRGDIVNKGLELLGRHLGMFVDKQEIKINGSLTERLQRAKERIRIQEKQGKAP